MRKFGLRLASLMAVALLTVSMSGTLNAADLVVLGVAGGPPFRVDHNNTGFMLVVNGEQYLIDSGGGSANNIMRVSNPATGKAFTYTAIHNIFFTHLHHDHVAGFVELISRGSWTIPTNMTSLTAYGPPGTRELVHKAKMTYMVAEEMHDLSNLLELQVHEFDLPKLDDHHERWKRHSDPIVEVFKDANVIVKATRVVHDGLDAYAYRFEIISGPDTGKSIVFSGDRGPGPVGTTPDLFPVLAQNATVMVHEALDTFMVDTVVASAPVANQAYLRAQLTEGHTDMKLLPQLAKDANVGMLVLSHYGPGNRPVSVFQGIVNAAAASCGYTGTIIASTELTRVTF